MTWLNRVVALFLALLIVVVTPVAIWTLNLRRVGLDPQTYKTALNVQDLYDNLMPVLMESAARSDSNATFTALTKNLSVADLGVFATALLPASWLKDQIDANIDRLFTWLNDASVMPDIRFDLTDLKQKLGDNDSAQAAVKGLLPTLSPCKADEISLIRTVASSKEVAKYPVCDPPSDDLRAVSITTLTGFLTAAAQKLPDGWSLDQNIVRPIAGSSAAPKGPNSTNRLSTNDIVTLRAGIWLASRLVLLFLLIPVFLLSLIIIVKVRSGRSLFRWIGSILLIGGVFTVIPVLVFPFRLATQFQGTQANLDQVLGPSAPLLSRLLSGVFASIDTQLTLSALVTAGAVILVGLFAILISIFWPEPEPTVEKWQVMLEQSGMTPAITFPNVAINDQPTQH